MVQCANKRANWDITRKPEVPEGTQSIFNFNGPLNEWLIQNPKECLIWEKCHTSFLKHNFFWILITYINYELIDFVLNIGLVKGEHKVWNFLNDIDYYIHGPVKNYFLDQYVAMYVGDKMYKDGEILNNPNGNQNNEKGSPNISFDKFL